MDVFFFRNNVRSGWSVHFESVPRYLHPPGTKLVKSISQAALSPIRPWWGKTTSHAKYFVPSHRLLTSSQTGALGRQISKLGKVGSEFLFEYPTFRKRSWQVLQHRTFFFPILVPVALSAGDLCELSDFVSCLLTKNGTSHWMSTSKLRKVEDLGEVVRSHLTEAWISTLPEDAPLPSPLQALLALFTVRNL